VYVHSRNLYLQMCVFQSQTQTRVLTSCTTDLFLITILLFFLTTTAKKSQKTRFLIAHRTVGPVSCFYCHAVFLFFVPFPQISYDFFACRLTPNMSNKKSTQTYTISQEIAAPNLAVSMCLCPVSLSASPSFRLSFCLSL
jgi:hypothetical protein